LFCLFVCFFFFFGVIFLERRTRRRKEDGQPVEGHPIFLEGNDNVGVNAMPETEPPGHDNFVVNDVPETEPLGHDNVGVNAVPKTGRGHKRHGRPRKNKDVMGIDEVVKQLLSDFEYIDGEDEDLFYNSDEVQRKGRERPTGGTVLSLM
jgi:hypothetical protein